jgi:hypothetical protein
MSEHAFFEYRAKLMSTPHIEEQGEPIHYLIKMENRRWPPTFAESFLNRKLGI